MIPRDLAASLGLALNLFPAVLLTGARRTGKTSLARHLWPDATYLNLEDPALATAASLDPDRLLRTHPEPLILDGLHYAPGLLPRLQRTIDLDRRPGRFLLVGLPGAALAKRAADPLAGRAAVFTLPPLSLVEVFPAASRDETAGFLWRSGFPDLWNDPGLDREAWLAAYVASLLERDLARIVNAQDLRVVDRFIRAAAVRAGQLISYAELARDSDISPNTARRWLAALEALQVVFALKPYPRSRAKRLIKTARLYFVDTGLLCFLMGLRHESQLAGHTLWRAVWENFVLAEVRKRLLAQASAPALWFWQTAHGDQVDLLLETEPERFVAVNCQASDGVSATGLKGINRLADQWGPASIARARIVCPTEQAFQLDSPFDARAVPLSGPEGMLAELAG